jgi:hypothetical protein
MSDGPFEPYVVILSSGPLSPAEDLETAIVVAAQSQSFGQAVLRIECGAEIILQGNKLVDAISKRLRETRGNEGLD